MRRHFFAVAAAVVAGLCLGVLIFIVVFDFKGVFQRRASAALGRTVTVASARIHLFPLRVVLRDLDIPGDRGAEAMMTADTIDATIAFWPLFSHRMVFSHLVVA